MSLLEEVEIPVRLDARPKDRRGYAVPYFVQWMKDGEGVDEGEGEPEFRVMDERKLRKCVNENRCWLCGDKLGRYRSYVAGPMCAVNRISAEPPSHESCATYAARVCPFLTNPKMHRVPMTMPDGLSEPAGIMLERNPGVAMVWTTVGIKWFRPPNGGILFDLGQPARVTWYAEGRDATREEVVASIDSGFPALEGMAKAEGPDAEQALKKALYDAMKLLPVPA